MSKRMAPTNLRNGKMTGVMAQIRRQAGYGGTAVLAAPPCSK